MRRRKRASSVGGAGTMPSFAHSDLIIVSIDAGPKAAAFSAALPVALAGSRAALAMTLSVRIPAAICLKCMDTPPESRHVTMTGGSKAGCRGYVRFDGAARGLFTQVSIVPVQLI